LIKENILDFLYLPTRGSKTKVHLYIGSKQTILKLETLDLTLKIRIECIDQS